MKFIMIKLSDAIYQRVQYFMDKNNLVSSWDLFKVTGIPNSTLKLLLSRKTKIPALSTLTQICYGLNTDLQEFFDDEMFKNIDDDL